VRARRWIPIGGLVLAVLVSAIAPSASQRRIVVATSAELSDALAKAGPGTVVAMRPGVYDSGVYIRNLTGTAAAPIVIEAADPANPPVVRGGSTGLQLSDAQHVSIRRITFEGQRQNGINIDDGETVATPSHHVTFREVTIRRLGIQGIGAAIKLSGVQDFVIEDSTIAEWGAGSAITMIGSHRGLIRRNVFRHGDDAGATGPQMKGGSTGITVRENRFEHAGLRAVQIGGSTDPQFFRPGPPSGFEARDCTVERNVFIGSEAAVAFVNVDGSVFRDNTIYRPRKWVLRILQEITSPGFVPSRRGVIAGNIVYYHGTDLAGGAVNAGGGTDAASFRFERNWWFRADGPRSSRPQLPSVETGGVYGRDPLFANAAGGDFRLAARSPASGYGAFPVPSSRF